MTSPVKSRKKAVGAFALSRRAFQKVAAVEGIRLTKDMEEDFERFDREGLSPAERRKVLAQKYGKTRQSP